MLIGDYADVFKDVAILPLAGVLLNLLIWYLKTRLLMSERQTQAVAGPEVPLVASGEISRGAIVCIVLGDWWA